MRISIFRFISIAVLLACLPLAGADAAGPQQGQFLQVPGMSVAGTISHVVGDAFILRQGQKIPARSGMMFQVMDGLETAPGAKIRVTFFDNTTIALGENSLFDMGPFLFAPDKKQPGNAEYRFAKGAFSYVGGLMASDPAATIALKTPCGMISPRGASVWASFPGAECQVYIEGGTASVSNTGGMATLDEKSPAVTIASATQTPAASQGWNPAQAASIKALTKF